MLVVAQVQDDAPGVRPSKERAINARTVADREQPKEFQGMDVVEPLLFWQACYTFASAVLDMDLERADYRGEPKVPPFLPMEDDLLGELFWPLALYSRENATFMP